jgi:poly(hydroxyalkanoate) depolymerase family esterase
MNRGLGIGCALVVALAACGDAPVERHEIVGTTSAALEAVTSFGSNPGKLAMYRYVPTGMPAKAPLVVALHGCTQTADAFAGNGLDALADQYKFYVVYPQQSTANNPVSCFDWWGAYNNPADKTNITRGEGENLSIKQMVDKTAADFSVDPSRVFVIGFSAGAAMAAVMLATWPDVFAAGAIDAGVPYDCPSTQNADVWMCMSPGKTLAASDWAARVKAAYPGYAGPYPRVSIWQGTQDHTVATANQTELVKQWTAVHGLPQTPSSMDMIDGYPRAAFIDGNQVRKVESWQITGMDHGFAIDPAHGCGAAGAYLVDKGICTAKHVVDFFGITGGASPSADGGGGAVPPSGTDGGRGGCCSGDPANGAQSPDAGDACNFCERPIVVSSCAIGRAHECGAGVGAAGLAIVAVVIARRRRRA